MRKKYKDCPYIGGDCTDCSRVHNWKDCHENEINPIRWYRMMNYLTQAQLASEAGIHVRHLQKLEAGQIDTMRMQFQTLHALADALDRNPIDLI